MKNFILFKIINKKSYEFITKNQEYSSPQCKSDPSFIWKISTEVRNTRTNIYQKVDDRNCLQQSRIRPLSHTKCKTTINEHHFPKLLNGKTGQKVEQTIKTKRINGLLDIRFKTNDQQTSWRSIPSKGEMLKYA